MFYRLVIFRSEVDSKIGTSPAIGTLNIVQLSVSTRCQNDVHGDYRVAGYKVQRQGKKASETNEVWRFSDSKSGHEQSQT